MLFWGIDIWYIILIVPCIILSLIANASVKSRFNKYSRILSSSGLTGAEAAKRVLQANGVNGVAIVPCQGNLTDNFNPKTGTISLSQPVYNSTSVAAIGVACHEAGHACQYAANYAPLTLRNMIIPITNIGAKLSWPLIILGLILSSVSQFGDKGIYFAYAGVLCFAFSTLFQLLTLPTELNASRRALKAIKETGILAENEIGGARKVLTAAAMTYFAALATSLAQLLRLILLVNRRSRE